MDSDLEAKVSSVNNLFSYAWMHFYRCAYLALFLMPFFASASPVMEGALSSPSDFTSLFRDKTSITVEFGLDYLHPDFSPIQNIIVSNPATSTQTTNQYGNVVNTYPDVFAQTIKAQMLIDERNQWTINLKTYLPLNALAQLDTGNIYQPEFVLYRCEMQRPRISISSGLNLSDHWRAALGTEVGFSVQSDVDVFLQAGEGRYSDQRVAAKLKPVLAPIASVSFKNYTFTVKSENKSTLEIDANAGARVFGAVGAGVNFSYLTQSAAYFEPWTFEFSGKNEISAEWKILWGLSYELWSRYQARAAVIQSQVPTSCPDNQGSCTSVFNAGETPAFQGRNLLVPELGLAYLWGNTRLQLGYRYKDSIFASVPTLNGNYLDPPRHDFKFTVIFPTLAGSEWSFYTLVSRLVPQTVVKSNPDEIGATADGSGYVAQGWLYGGGVSLSIPLKQL